jgi:long-chain fatty acid transport protein
MTPSFESCSRPVLAAVSLLAIASSGSLLAQGGGLAVYEVGTPNLGEAYAGQAAIASDASTSFLNPAGMTRLAGTQVLAGGQLDLLSTRFRADAATTISGGNGGNGGGAFLVPSFYVSRSINSRVSFGFSLNSPFGLGLRFDDGWVGRYAMQQIRLAVVEASPSVGYRASSWLSVGAGLSLERASLSQRTAVPNLFEPALGDGQLDVRLHAWGTGFRVGALLEAGRRTKIGVTYRSEADFSLAGAVTPANIGPAMAAVLPRLPSSGVPLALPRGANVSFYREWNRTLALLADAGWTNWRTFGRQQSQAPDGSTVVTDRHWRDTWHTGVGLRWRVNGRTTLHTGASYDSAPVSDWNRTPDLPVDRQWRFAAGVTREISRTLSVALTASYTDLGSARIERWLSPGVGRVSGQYGAARLPFLSLSFLFRPSAGRNGE